MADQMSGYDGEIDWEAEIIAADLAALQRAEREQKRKREQVFAETADSARELGSSR